MQNRLGGTSDESVRSPVVPSLRTPFAEVPVTEQYPHDCQAQVLSSRHVSRSGTTAHVGDGVDDALGCDDWLDDGVIDNEYAIVSVANMRAARNMAGKRANGRCRRQQQTNTRKCYTKMDWFCFRAVCACVHA